MIDLIRTTWLAIRIWYLQHLLAAVERHGKYGSADYLQWSMELIEVKRQAGVQ